MNLFNNRFDRCLLAKESIFSGLNNLKINSILDNRYGEYFGFTASEVQEMAEYYGASGKYQELCDWYDGYHFGDTDIFNPWSVIGYFNNNCQPKAFWQSTGSNDIIREVLTAATPDIMERLEALMKGESFLTYIDTGVIYPQIQKDPFGTRRKTTKDKSQGKIRCKLQGKSQYKIYSIIVQSRAPARKFRHSASCQGATISADFILSHSWKADGFV